MINDIGSNNNFKFSDLSNEDLRLIASADLVCVLDWALNKKGGLDLAKKVFKFAKAHNVTTYLDTADPSHRKKQEIEQLKNQVFGKNLVDILSLNENELNWYSTGENYSEKIRFLRDEYNINVNLHTSKSASDGEISVPTFNVNPVRMTGAGDCWNAGNIFGILVGLKSKERFLFANALSALYISTTSKFHPTLEEIINYLKNQIL
jgi:sugar/nucleoside kinase (ribokinase family)